VLRAKGVQVTEVVDHGWSKSIYFKDPNGMSLEYCGTLRDLTEDDATMPERFTVPRAALEYGNETAAITARHTQRVRRATASEPRRRFRRGPRSVSARARWHSRGHCWPGLDLAEIHSHDRLIGYAIEFWGRGGGGRTRTYEGLASGFTALQMLFLKDFQAFCCSPPQKRLFRRRKLRTIVATREEVAINIQGHADRRMAQPLLNQLRC
jgi:hypothetical protein